MPQYLLQLAYTAQAWRVLSQEPTDRMEAVRGLIETLGGQTLAAYYAFGEYDGVILAELPDHVHAAAVAVAAKAAGHYRAFKTTVLLPVEDTVAALRLAGGLASRPPMAAQGQGVATEDQTRAVATAHEARHSEGDAATTASMESMDASDPPSWTPERS